MRVRWLPLCLSLVIVGCQDKKTDPPAKGTGTAVESATPNPPADTPTVLAGQINGKTFVPDQVTLEGNTLTFRKGKDFFAEMEIRFSLPEGSRAKLEGKEWKFEGDNFGNPTVWVSTSPPKGVPKPEFVWPKDYTMTVKVTKQTPKQVSGNIDLKVTKPANTHLKGAFTATIKKTLDDPLDAEDAPYVQGRILSTSKWNKEEKLSAGFFGKAADGKGYSNMAGTSVSPGSGGGATSLSFEPQLTSITNPKEGPGYRHTKLQPGEYIVYVRRNDVFAAWKKVTVKANDQLTVDLTIDPSKFGEVTATLPDEEANDFGGWHLSLIPLELDKPGESYHFTFNVAEVKKGDKTVTVKGVPAGKYRAVRGKSEGIVDVTPGKTATVTLSRVDPKKK
jgi:hypothetical protein